MLRIEDTSIYVRLASLGYFMLRQCIYNDNYKTWEIQSNSVSNAIPALIYQQ